MRLYFLLRTPLDKVGEFAEPPQAGDVLCYARRAQDPIGEFEERLRSQKISIYFLDDLLDRQTIKLVDEKGAQFIEQWFLDGETDISVCGQLSMGLLFATEIANKTNPRMLIGIGEAFKKLLEKYQLADDLFSDAKDGVGVFETNPKFFPIAGVVRHVATSLGRKVHIIDTSDALPTAYKAESSNSIRKVVRSFLGQFRPNWIKAKIAYIKNRRENLERPVFYSFIGRGHDRIVSKIAATDMFRVVCNFLNVSGADSMRCDHLIALPKRDEILSALKLLAILKDRSNASPSLDRYIVSGVGYDKILYRAVYDILKLQIWAFLIVAAQAKKLQKKIGMSAVLINEANCEPMGALILLNRNSKSKNIYLVPHGMNVTKQSILSPAVDQNHITYIAYGSDHTGYYESENTDGEETKKMLLGNPLTTVVNSIRETRSTMHGKRLLLFTFGHTTNCFSRSYTADTYYSKIFTIVPALISEGWTINIRPHPYHSHGLEDHLIEAHDLSGQVGWDNSPTIEQCLPNYDVVVSNITTAYYQAMYAGWPTIFFEPDYKKTGTLMSLETNPIFTGLPTANDLDRPVTNDPDILARYIRDSLNPMSMVATFPKKFAGELSPRFIGPNPANADRDIANYLIKDFANGEPLAI